MEIISLIFLIILGLQVLYLFIFAIAATLSRKANNFPTATQERRIAIFIPAYSEDAVIADSVTACMQQNYPKDKYDIIVISDRMTNDTNQRLQQLPLILVRMPEEENTKAKALNIAIKQIRDYDIAVILDADNQCSPQFLETINKAFESGCKAIQTHRTAKNTDKPFALLDAVSEEINNSIFRKGHNALGFSSALIGSGMAFDYTWFKTHMPHVNTAGEDKEIENLLLKEKIKITYLDKEWVLDEKVSQSRNFYQQRRRWLSAQFYHLLEILPQLPIAICNGNYNLVNKILQQMLLPRVLLLGAVLFCTLFFSLWNLKLSFAWCILLGTLILTLLIAIPKRMMNQKLLQAICKIPVAFGYMFLNLFRIKGGNKKFIHTTHGK